MAAGAKVGARQRRRDHFRLRRTDLELAERHQELSARASKLSLRLKERVRLTVFDIDHDVVNRAGFAFARPNVFSRQLAREGVMPGLAHPARRRRRRRAARTRSRFLLVGGNFPGIKILLRDHRQRFEGHLVHLRRESLGGNLRLQRVVFNQAQLVAHAEKAAARHDREGHLSALGIHDKIIYLAEILTIGAGDFLSFVFTGRPFLVVLAGSTNLFGRRCHGGWRGMTR